MTILAKQAFKEFGLLPTDLAYLTLDQIDMILGEGRTRKRSLSSYLTEKKHGV